MTSRDMNEDFEMIMGCHFFFFLMKKLENNVIYLRKYSKKMSGIF